MIVALIWLFLQYGFNYQNIKYQGRCENPKYDVEQKLSQNPESLKNVPLHLDLKHLYPYSDELDAEPVAGSDLLLQVFDATR